MIAIEKIREALDRLRTFHYGAPGFTVSGRYVAKQDVLSMLDKLEVEEIPCPYCEEEKGE